MGAFSLSRHADMGVYRLGHTSVVPTANDAFIQQEAGQRGWQERLGFAKTP